MSNYYYWSVTPEGKWLLHNTWGEGRGDLVWRMAIYALITGDADVIKACIKLLNERKRWPDGLKMDMDAKNYLEYYWLKALHKLRITNTHKHRHQKSITRDPYIMLTCAIFWHQYELIRDLKIPFWINRPSLYYWKKYLETRKSCHKVKYERLTKFSIRMSVAFGFPAYVKSLLAWRAFIAQSDEIKAELIKHIPHWSYPNRLMCGDLIPEQDVKSYISHSGWIWNADKVPDDLRELGEGEPIHLDKEYLNFVFDNKNW